MVFPFSISEDEQYPFYELEPAHQPDNINYSFNYYLPPMQVAILQRAQRISRELQDILGDLSKCEYVGDRYVLPSEWTIPEEIRQRIDNLRTLMDNKLMPSQLTEEELITEEDKMVEKFLKSSGLCHEVLLPADDIEELEDVSA